MKEQCLCSFIEMGSTVLMAPDCAIVRFRPCRHTSRPWRLLAWADVANEGASIHIEDTNRDHDAGAIHIVNSDIHVVGFVRGSVDEPGAGRHVIAHAATDARRRLMARGSVGIPKAALARRGQMAFGNAERRIPMLVEVAVIPAITSVFRLRPVLLVLLMLLMLLVLLVFRLSLFAVRLSLPLVGPRQDRDGRHQEQHREQA
jgi:hypothetical protein